ncbi:MAG: DUF6456 domain-containing protein [Pseudomonadota bacterium]
MPRWVPPGAHAYLSHTMDGLPIRELARRSGQHASTVLRQIRRFEAQRDDPLVDAALRSLGDQYGAPRALHTETRIFHMQAKQRLAQMVPDDVTFDAAAARILRRLAETGAILAVAADMDKAVVVREGPAGQQRTAVVDRAVAEALALKGWIATDAAGRITRYQITAAGRTALRDMRPEAGFSERPAAFAGAEPEEEGRRRGRYGLAESPLSALARRREKDGTPFLNGGQVGAGERLREDFELSNMGPNATQNWDQFVRGAAPATGAPDESAPGKARGRVAAALTELGPGLAEIALRCCCHLEGLETAEKSLGWSARSGKIVLRIALTRLARHYEAEGSGLIG